MPGAHTMFPSSALSAEWLFHIFSFFGWEAPPVPPDDPASYFTGNIVAIKRELQVLMTTPTTHLEPDQ